MFQHSDVSMDMAHQLLTVGQLCSAHAYQPIDPKMVSRHTWGCIRLVSVRNYTRITHAKLPSYSLLIKQRNHDFMHFVIEIVHLIRSFVEQFRFYKTAPDAIFKSTNPVETVHLINHINLTSSYFT